MTVVTERDVLAVARLAKLQLAESELAKLSQQLNDILTYVKQLQAVPTDGIEPTSHVVPISNVERPDQIQPSLTPDDALRIAPARHGQLYKVPKIVDSDS